MKKSKLLNINLSSKSYDYRNVNLEFIGGRGFAVECYSMLKDKNAIVIATAKYSQNPHEASGRYSIGYYSPLYKKFRTSSVKGNFGKSIADLGLDIISINGELESNGIVIIKKDEVEFLQNTNLELKSTPFIKIGESGKKLSPVATAFDETGRQFGQGGLGGIFGNKKIQSLFVISNVKKEIPLLPPDINCNDCKKQNSISNIESVANKYFIDSHLFSKLSKHLNVNEKSQLENLAEKILQKNAGLIDYLENFGILISEPRKDNDKMILGDCLGLCGLAMSNYNLNPNEVKLITSIVSTEESLK